MRRAARSSSRLLGPCGPQAGTARSADGVQTFTREEEMFLFSGEKNREGPTRLDHFVSIEHPSWPCPCVCRGCRCRPEGLWLRGPAACLSARRSHRGTATLLRGPPRAATCDRRPAACRPLPTRQRDLRPLHLNALSLRLLW